jgi:lactate dehydrogenase-like 2-hydroxyacid dehydrogenase
MVGNDKKCECDCTGNKRWWKHARGYGRTGHIYGLGVVGALFYFLQNANSFQMVLIGMHRHHETSKLRLELSLGQKDH